MRDRMRGTRAAAGLALGLATLLAGTSAAYDAEVTSTTVGQGYQLRRFNEAGQSEMLSRRRLTQYLGLGIFNLQPEAWSGAARDRNLVGFSAQLRFDTDFGNYLRDAPGGPDRIRELADTSAVGQQFDLLLAAVTLRSGLGFLDADLGRQIVVDSFDYFAFDGLQVRARTPAHVAVLALAGLMVRGEHPLGSDAFELDGTSGGSRDPFNCGGARADRCPEQDRELAPVLGAGLETEDLDFVVARVGYRRTWSSTAGFRDPDLVAVLAAQGHAGDVRPGSGVLEEKLTVQARFLLGHALFPFGGFRYNFLLGSVDEVQGGVRALLPWGGQIATVEYLYLFPSFEGDSIFNVFSTEAYHDVRGTWDLPVGPATLYLRALGRVYANQPLAGTGQYGAWDDAEYGVGAGARARTGRLAVRADLQHRDGFGGRRAGGDVWARYDLVPERLDVEARVSVVAFELDLQPALQDGVTLGLQGGARYRFADNVAAHLLVEENVNRFFPSALRVIALLDLEVRP